MTRETGIPNRRRFLAGGAAAAAGWLALSASRLEGAERRLTGAHPDAWMDRMVGEERFLVDAPDPAEGRMLGLIHHFYDVYANEYKLSAQDVSAAGTFYGKALFLALNDAMWARYPLGASIDDPSLKQNPWRTAPTVRGRVVPYASIEALLEQGAVFLLCHDGLMTRARQLARQLGRSSDEILPELEANILPGVILVPSVIVAIQRAQRRGIAYYQIP